MAYSLLNRINFAIQKLEQTIAFALGRRFPPDGFCMAGVEIDHQWSPHSDQTGKKFSLKDILSDGFLWAVPKHRRSLEKRWKRKYGIPDLHYKIMLPKTNLQTCNTCGDDHEIGVLCPTCYKKVIDETKAMQDEIQKELALEPIEKEVIVLYEGEKDSKPTEYWEGKRIVEMQKPRPSWFSKNLMQQTTQQPSTASDVKPSSLG